MSRPSPNFRLMHKLLQERYPPFEIGEVTASPHAEYLFALLLKASNIESVFLPDQDDNDDDSCMAYLPAWRISNIASRSLQAEGLTIDKGRSQEQYTSDYAQRVSSLRAIQTAVLSKFADAKSLIDQWAADDAQLSQRSTDSMPPTSQLQGIHIHEAVCKALGGVTQKSVWRERLCWDADSPSNNDSKRDRIWTYSSYIAIPEEDDKDPCRMIMRWQWDHQEGDWVFVDEFESEDEDENTDKVSKPRKSMETLSHPQYQQQSNMGASTSTEGGESQKQRKALLRDKLDSITLFLDSSLQASRLCLNREFRDDGSPVFYNHVDFLFSVAPPQSSSENCSSDRRGDRENGRGEGQEDDDKGDKKRPGRAGRLRRLVKRSPSEKTQGKKKNKRGRKEKQFPRWVSSSKADVVVDDN